MINEATIEQKLCASNHPGGSGSCTRPKGHDGDHVTQRASSYASWASFGSEHEGTWKEPGEVKCYGCETVYVRPSMSGWYHGRFKNVDYMACSKNCWEDTLRKYPALLEAKKRDALSRLERAAQANLDAAANYEDEQSMVTVELADLERIEKGGVKPDEPAKR